MNAQFSVRRWAQRVWLLLSLGIAAPAWAVAPSFVNQPQGATGYVGGSASIDSALVSGTAPVTYQWRKEGAPLSGANDRTLTRTMLTLADAGDYTLVATNGEGSAISNVAHLTVLPAVVPYFTYVPATVTQLEGRQVTLYVDGGGSNPITFQWYKDGVLIEGANLYYLTIATMSQAAVGSYTLKMTNAGGSATSSPIALSIRLPDPPTISYYGNPTSASVYEGQSISLNAYADGTSPFAVKWKKDGVVVAEQTNVSSYAYFSVTAATLADAGSYTATFENAAGSATTTAAVIVVNPAVAPVITRQPTGGSVYVSASFNMSVECTGTPPQTYQWFHGETPIANATSSWFQIDHASAADAGSYTVKITNHAGSVTSNAVSVAVSMPPPPQFTSVTADASIVQGNNMWLYAGFTSEVSAYSQWYHNGTAMEGKTDSSLSIYNFQASDGGTYQLVATNAGGTTRSREIVVTYIAAELPVFVTQPSDTSGLPGGSVTLSVSVTCNAAVTFSWFKDGNLSNDSSWSSLSVAMSEPNTSHVYKVRATSAAGSVESRSVTVVTGPAQPARLSTTIGGSTNFTTYISLSAATTGTQPISYQWYRNGAAIPGATSSSYMLSPATAADYADYHVAVSNAIGSDTSDRATYRPVPINPGFPAEFWLDALERNGVYYFLMTNPGRIERYDLGSEAWLPTWSIDGSPRAFAVADDAVYVAIDRSIYKYPANWGVGTPLANAKSNVWRMSAVGNYLFIVGADFYDSERFTTRNRQTGALIDARYSSSGFSGGRMVYDAQTGRMIGGSDGYTIAADGKLGDPKSLSTQTQTGCGSMLLPGTTKGVDSTGYVFNTSDMSYAGNFDGAVDDVVSGDNGYLVLRGARVIATDLHYGQISSLSIPGRGERMVRKQGSVVVFGQPTTAATRPPVWKLELAGLSAPTVAPVLADPSNQVFFPEEVSTDSNGVIYILDRLERNVLRWSEASQAYLPSIPLPFKANHFAVESDGSAIYVDNGSAAVRKILLEGNNPAGDPLYVARNGIGALQKAGDFLLVGTSATPAVVSVAMTGSEVGSCAGLYVPAVELTWRESSRRVLMRSASYYPVYCVTLGMDGAFDSSPAAVPGGGYTSMARVSPAGDRVINDQGYAYNLSSMASTGSLPNAVADVVWNGGAVHTIRSGANGATEVATLSADAYLLQRKRTFEGDPVRLFAYGADSVVLVTKRLGKLVFRVLNTTELGQYPASFSATAYLARHPGVAAAIGDVPDKFERAWQHYLSYGASEGAADFNRDGKSDLVWTNTATGERRVWLSWDSGYGSAVSLGAVPGEWVKSGAGDFDLDGQPDIVWTNTATGERRIWLMQGTGYRSEVSLGVVPVEWVIAGVGDFNSDSGPDLLWRNAATGEVRLWLMNGTSYASDVSLGVLPAHWAISGVADFDRNGSADILWTNTATGERLIWQMQGTTHSGSATLGIVAANLRISAVGDYNGDGWPDLLMTDMLTDERVIWLLNGATRIGTRSLGAIGAEWVLDQAGLEPIQVPQHDLNGDGKSDLLWENTTTGDRAVWFLEGTGFASSGSLGNVAAAWRIAGTADFNADGKPDLVWENATTGEHAVWFMNGTTYIGSVPLGTVPTVWHIAAVADFNGDTSPDLVWENTTTGERAVWFMNGTTYIATFNLGVLGTNWRIVGAGDFDRDGNPDLVWENSTTGERYLWLMDGPDYLESVYLGTAATQWHIAGAADYNSDGGPDILWENTTTGERGLWLMDGTTFSSWVPLATTPTAWRLRN